MAEKEGVIVAIGHFVAVDGGKVSFQPNKGTTPILAKGDRVGFIIENEKGEAVQIGPSDIETLDLHQEVAMVLFQSNQTVQ